MLQSPVKIILPLLLVVISYSSASLNLVDQCTLSYRSNTYNDHVFNLLCDQFLIHTGAKFDDFMKAVQDNKQGPTFVCLALAQVTQIRSFNILGPQSYDNWTNMPAYRNMRFSIYSGDRSNFVGNCIDLLDGEGWYICGTVYQGDIVCLESDTGENIDVVELMVFEKLPIQQNAISIAANQEDASGDINKLIAPLYCINYQKALGRAYQKQLPNVVTEIPVITLKLNAQVPIRAIALMPSFKSSFADDYNMPTSDQTCNNYRNKFLVSVTDVDDKVHTCTSLQDISYYKESDCNDEQAHIITITFDIDNTDQVANGVGSCTNDRRKFAFQQLNVMADCLCSGTSLVEKNMPNAPPLAPSIPSELIINKGDAMIRIDFVVGYDTVSCTCGNGDCFTECNSEAGMSATFIDNLTGQDVTLSILILKWHGDWLSVQWDESKIGSHSLSVQLGLTDYPTSEARTYSFNVTVNDEVVYQTEYSTIVTGFTNTVTEKNLRELLDPQDGETLILELSMETATHDLELTVNDLTLNINSLSDLDEGNHIINLLVVYENNPNRPSSTVEVTLLLQTPTTTDEDSPTIVEEETDSGGIITDDIEEESDSADSSSSETTEEEQKVTTSTTTPDYLLNILKSLKQRGSQTQASLNSTEKSEVKVEIPYLYQTPMNQTGYIELHSSCNLYPIKNPNELLYPQQKDLSDSLPFAHLSFVIQETNADESESRNVNNLTIQFIKVTKTMLAFQFNFAAPQNVSVSAEGYDILEVFLLSSELLKCQDGRRFKTSLDQLEKQTDNASNAKGGGKSKGAILSSAIPPQLLSTQVQFIAETKQVVGDIKMIALVNKGLKVLKKSALNSFFASILALNFMTFQMGFSLNYPAVLTVFLGQIMDILNQDLLSDFQIFEIDFSPRPYLVDPYTDQLGFLGFDSQSLVNNIGTMIWVIFASFVNIFFVLLGHHIFKNLENYTKSRKWFSKNYKLQFFNGIYDTYDSYQLTLLLMALIQLDGLIRFKSEYYFSMTDIIMMVILVGFPLINFCLCKITLQHYDSLQSTKSTAYRSFGNYVKGIQLGNLQKHVTILTCLRNFLKYSALSLIITRFSYYPGLQIIMANFLIEADIIFMVYFKPYGKDDDRQKDEDSSNMQCMFFNYQMICYSDFVTDIDRRQQLAQFTMYFSYSIFGVKFAEWIIPTLKQCIKKAKEKRESKNIQKNKSQLRSDKEQMRKEEALQNQREQLQILRKQIYTDLDRKQLVLSTKIGNGIDVERNYTKRKNVIFDQSVFHMIFQELETQINNELFWYVKLVNQKTKQPQQRTQVRVMGGKQTRHLNFFAQYLFSTTNKSIGISLKLPNPKEDFLKDIRKLSKTMPNTEFPQEIRKMILNHVQVQVVKIEGRSVAKKSNGQFLVKKVNLENIRLQGQLLKRREVPEIQIENLNNDQPDHSPQLIQDEENPVPNVIQVKTKGYNTNLLRIDPEIIVPKLDVPSIPAENDPEKTISSNVQQVEDYDLDRESQRLTARVNERRQRLQQRLIEQRQERELAERQDQEEKQSLDY